MRPYLLILFTLLSALPTLAQKHEYGAGLGGMLYKGDLNPSFDPRLTRIAGTVFYKYNPSYATALRVAATFGSLTGNGGLSPDPYVKKFAAYSFSTPMVELHGGFEYNFFDYRNPKIKNFRGTPYLFLGLGLFVFSPDVPPGGKGTTPVQPCLPFGIGYKYRLSKHLNLGVEFAARKTFTDNLDGVSDTDYRTMLQQAFKYSSDLYAYFGVTLSYTKYEIQCPADFPGF